MSSATRNQKRLINRYLNKAIDSISQEELISLLEQALGKLEPNLILLTDAYKYSHADFYPEDMTYMCSYMESRGGKFEETVMFGLQYMIKKYLVGQVLSEDMINEADEKLNGKGGVFMGEQVFAKQRWLDLLEAYDGRYPVRIKSVAEGEIVPTKNVLLTVESTDERFPWCASFIEGILLENWYPITVATLSHHVLKIVKKYLLKTGTPIDLIDVVASFVLNDFGFRGVSSVESAALGGSAHLVSSSGSDNIIASDMLMNYYNATEMLGKGIRATEHSVMTLKGEAGELGIMRRLLEKYPTGYVACVSDSFNIIRACKEYWGGELKELVLSRNGVLVIRPDSGDVLMTLKMVFEALFESFGYTTNSAGFKVLPPQVRVIQGDGVNYESIDEIYQMLFENGIAAENLVLGMGGKLLQADINRDTLNFAIKACNVIIGGKSFNVFKSPTEIDKFGNMQVSFKKSKSGKMKLVKIDGKYQTITSSESNFDTYQDELKIVYMNGDLLIDYDILDIRKRANFNVAA